MKQRIFRMFAAAAAVGCMIFSAAMPVSAARPYDNAKNYCKLYDPDGFLDSFDVQSLSDTIAQTSDEIDMYIAVYVMAESGKDKTDFEVETFADDKYDEFYNVQYEEESDGLMLVLDIPTHYIYITTCGMGQLYYYNGSEDDRISTMNTNLHPYLQNDDYSGAITRFCKDAVYYYEKGIPANAFTYNLNNGEYIYSHNGEIVHAQSLPWWFGVNWIFLLPLSAVIGALTALISYLIIRNSYQLKKTLDATNYISNNDTRFYVQDDIFLRTHTTKTYHDPNRGGGGGGGGGSSHMSSGGFSHGGGGSHW